MFRVSVLAFVLVACGSSKAQETTNQSNQVPSPAAAPSPSSPTNSALLVNDSAALPACTQDREGSLAYVKGTSEFEACSNGSWAVIDIQGPKGDAGAEGPTGPAGPAGKDGQPVPTNEWVDQMTGATWLVMGLGQLGQTGGPCISAKWRAPSDQELQAAATHGLFAGLSAIGVTTPNEYRCGYGDAPVAIDMSDINCGNAGTVYGIFCIQK